MCTLCVVYLQTNYHLPLHFYRKLYAAIVHLVCLDLLQTPLYKTRRAHLKGFPRREVWFLGTTLQAIV